MVSDHPKGVCLRRRELTVFKRKKLQTSNCPMVIQILDILFKNHSCYFHSLLLEDNILQWQENWCFWVTIQLHVNTCKYILSTFSCLLFKCSLASVLIGLRLLSFGDGFTVASFLSLPLTKSVFTVWEMFPSPNKFDSSVFSKMK